ncbi:MAG: radical SAM protein [Deltaproteobacteria bacterium]|jgi:wyosine [tRNA(Phe)-imidazoG37] synthetase (radical SAM superfamily)|nr:radical SAM protein [Deltaproteobacteria bacterium]
MSSSSIRPVLLVSDPQGNIYENNDLLMLSRRGHELVLPKPGELMPLPPDSEIFLLPGRKALGLDPESGEVVEQDDLAVGVFAAPGHTLSAHPAYKSNKDAPMLPLFAYGAVGFYNGSMYICASRVDRDQRQVFSSVSQKKLRKAALDTAYMYPENNLIQHLVHKCTLTYGCPAAKNFCLGRYEAPLPTSRNCNARCVGCISQRDTDSPLCSTPQSRLNFTPTAVEIVEIMRHHSATAVKPIYSFGQGCEGEPLTEFPLLLESISNFRAEGGRGTINLNSNASMPDKVAKLCEAGLSSLRVSLNSAREVVYNAYYRPVNYEFASVRQSIREAKKRGVFVSLNLLFFPGFTDTELETEILEELIEETKLDFIQLRNLNIDPEYYLELMDGYETGPTLGLDNFQKRLRRNFPWLNFGYFNPYIEDGKIPEEDIPIFVPEVKKGL